jgi:hypothetical protein
VSDAPPAVELHARRWRNATLFAAGALVMTLAGVLLIGIGLTGGAAGIVLVPAGALGVFFFGGVLVTGLRDMLEPRSIRLGGDGIEIRRSGETLRLAWEEVEHVGEAVMSRNHIVGLRLRDPAAAARRAPAAAAGSGPGARWVVAVSGALLRILPAARRPGDPVRLLAANRRMLGFDIGLGWADRDRSARELLELIERYRALRSA